MADQQGAGFSRLRGFADGLKGLGSKVVDLGGTVANKVVDGASTTGQVIAGTAVGVGNRFVDTVSRPLFEGDFERMRQLNQLARQQQDLRKKFTEEELQAVEKRADLVLSQLHEGYFEQNFDPVAYELSKLTDADDQTHMDELVEKLTYGVEVGPLQPFHYTDVQYWRHV
jgi:hypothetical protein